MDDDYGDLDPRTAAYIDNLLRSYLVPKIGDIITAASVYDTLLDPKTMKEIAREGIADFECVTKIRRYIEDRIGTRFDLD